MAVKFGTSGLRGLSTELAGSVSALYSTAFARFLLDQGLATPGSPVVVAQDFRPSSPEIAATVMAALKRAGLTPIDCGPIPTPALALYGGKINAAGIMVTGSHIPADRNGIKFYRAGEEITKADEAAITALADTLSGDVVANKVEAGRGENQEQAATELFLARNTAILPASTLKGLRIGIYQHSTVARDMMVTVFEHYGAQVFPLGRSEQFIPVDTEAVSDETIRLLAEWSNALSLDAIVSTDGDGDRPLVADEHGRPLRGDFLGLIATRFLGAKVAVTPVTSNSGLEAAGGFEVVRTRVGSPFVIAAMEEALAAGKSGVIGFEANGGLMLGSPFTIGSVTLKALPTRDSFLPALAVLGTAARAGQSLSALATTYRLPIALSDRLEDFAVERSTALMAHLRASADNLSSFVAPLGQVKSVSDIDGLRVTLADDSVVHFRPSGNAPEMRCYVEAPDQTTAEALLAKGLKTLAGWQPTA
ncbi:MULTISPECIES: phosphomannomutase [Alphaproteobacteria]|uniref:Phosphomannomutase n=2 Tax=Alphaproteobacteria TaxID=28211 RepID=A0A512HIM5_9HYPH|nr:MULTISPECIES: phosphomannomutase [Alphaproteobacteria]GEO85305.1 phosphomannomutase [Ciceribacter naphthalenivorans]GLR20944.1 phosphomannomutase [Ciceribacter naphthalenivorans]GLT03800.1 phosphomannomutase [Sphingomonas psychrolutea]